MGTGMWRVGMFGVIVDVWLRVDSLSCLISVRRA